MQALGKINDEYTIIDLLGGGGFGNVFAARRLKDNQLVALKIINPEKMQNGDFEQGIREAKNAMKLNHNNITKTYNYG